MAESIFSKEALEKLRSPDRLDLMMPITKPVHWMIIAAVGVFLFSVILWSIFGAFTVTADGMGLITDYGGIVTITSSESSGTLISLAVRSGMPVEIGDCVAHVINSQNVANLLTERESLELAGSDREVRQRAYDFDSKNYAQMKMSEIFSAYSGIVDEIMVRKGDMLNPGTPICTVRLTENSEELNGVLYIPVKNGKRVEPGMIIQIVPNGIDVKESGSLVATVRSVSQYPISPQGIQARLGNSQLAQWITNSQGGSALMEVEFDLVEDENSESGYLWTSVVGEHKPITPGSFCTGSIVIERQAPIEKVFYKISQWLRSR